MRELVTFPQTVLRSLRLLLSLIGWAERGPALWMLVLSLAAASCDRAAVTALTGAVAGAANFWRIDLVVVIAAVIAGLVSGRWARLIGLGLMERMVDRLLLDALRRVLAADWQARGAAETGRTMTAIARRMRNDVRQIAMALPSVAVLPVTVVWIGLNEPGVLVIMGLFPLLPMSLAAREVTRLVAGRAVLAEAEAQFDRVVDHLLSDATPVRPIDLQSGTFATQALWPAVDDTTRAASLLARAQLRTAGLLEWLAVLLVLLLFAFTYLDGQDPGWLPALLLVVATLPHMRRAASAALAVARAGEAAIRIDTLAHGFAQALSPVPPAPSIWRSITLDGLCVDGSGPGRQSIGPVSFTLGRGMIIALTGPGALDRSTLLLVLCGLLPPDRGAVLVDGFPVPPAMLRGLCGAVLHRGRVPATLPHFEPSRAAAMLERLGLPLASLEATDLSEAERVRLTLALTELEDRPLRLYDERAAHVEQRHRAAFIEMLRAARQSGRTCIIATQDAQIIAVADHVLRMEDGVITGGGAVP